MLFLYFVLYLPFFVGTLKNEIEGPALELWQLKIEQFSPGILKFSTKHKDNLLTINLSKVSQTFLFIFHVGCPGLGSKNFRNPSCKEKTAGSVRVSRLSFHFLWLWCHLIMSSNDSSKTITGKPLIKRSNYEKIFAEKYITNYQQLHIWVRVTTYMDFEKKKKEIVKDSVSCQIMIMTYSI